MIFGIVITLAGYSIFYWGVHHFPGWDCNACPPKNDCCRYSLLELLGVPKAWGIAKYSSVGITPGNQPPATTQQQNAENRSSRTNTMPVAMNCGGQGNSLHFLTCQ